MFLKVRETLWVNMSLVSKVIDSPDIDSISICFVGGDAHVGSDWFSLKGDERRAFRQWLQDHTQYTTIAWERTDDER